MTTFPSITPAERIHLPGEAPREAHVSANGRVSMVRLSNGRMGDRLQLQFQGLTTVELHDLTDHAADHGTWRRFGLPATVWVGTTDPTPSGCSWVYVASPDIDDPPGIGDVDGGFHSAAVELQLQPLPAHA